MADPLSQFKNKGMKSVKLEIDDSFPDEQVLVATLDLVPWYADFDNYLVSNIILDDLKFHHRKKFLYNVNNYFYDKPYLLRRCADNIIRRV